MVLTVSAKISQYDSYILSSLYVLIVCKCSLVSYVVIYPGVERPILVGICNDRVQGVGVFVASHLSESRCSNSNMWHHWFCVRGFLFGGTIICVLKPDLEKVILSIDIYSCEWNRIGTFICREVLCFPFPLNRYILALPVGDKKVNSHIIGFFVTFHLLRCCRIIINIRRERDRHFFGGLTVERCILGTNQKSMLSTIVGEIGQCCG